MLSKLSDNMDQFYAAVEQQPWVELELEFEPWPEA
jgi:hypothetical protein